MQNSILSIWPNSYISKSAIWYLYYTLWGRNWVDRVDLDWEMMNRSILKVRNNLVLLFHSDRLYYLMGIKFRYIWTGLLFKGRGVFWMGMVGSFLRGWPLIEYFTIFRWGVVGLILCSIVLNMIKYTQISYPER